jgi:demethylmenaquinone methyltransferase / 2-methoxy-6-polyprenyl-1,4-benzoquinol methylase
LIHVNIQKIPGSIFLIFEKMENLQQTGTGKKEHVRHMFDSIAWRYDFLNHFLSFSIDKIWRRKAVRSVGGLFVKPLVLDVATGTGDLAIAALKLNPVSVKGIDISEKMLEFGRKKLHSKDLAGRIELMTGDSENIPFQDESFDVTMVAFGVRNFADPLKGLSEMYRVLKNDGVVMVLEFSRPERFPFRNIYSFYFTRMLPFIGRFFSKDKSAYNYLPESVMRFPDNEAFLSLLQEAGFSETVQKRLSGGIASIYRGKKVISNR